MQILIYGSEYLIDCLSDLGPGRVSEPVTPNESESFRYLLIIQDQYSVDNRTVMGEVEIVRLRKEHCSCPIILVVKPQVSPELAARVQVEKDPYVVSWDWFELCSGTHFMSDLLAAFPPLLNGDERNNYFFDLRQSLYDSKKYISVLKHQAQTALQKCDDNNLADARSIFAHHWDVLTNYLRRERLLSGTREERETLAEGCRTATSVRLLRKELPVAYRQVLERLKEFESQTQKIGEQHILYVGDTAGTGERLAAVLDEHFDGKIVCHYAPDYASAEEELIRRPTVSVLLADYRFWAEGGKKFAPLNGQTIINRLRRNHPGLYAGYFTYNHPKQVQFGIRMKTTDIFSKGKILEERDPTELGRLHQAIMHNALSYNLPTDRWPAELNNKVDTAYRFLHDEIHLADPDVNEVIHRSNEEASKTIANILSNKSYYSGHLSPVKDLSQLDNPQDRLAYMRKVMLARKVILGLLNIPDLPKKLPDEAYQYCPPSGRQKGQFFNLIFNILNRPRKATDLGKKKVSDFFTNRLRIYLSKDYRLTNDHLEQHLVGEEFRWLRSIADQLQKY